MGKITDNENAPGINAGNPESKKIFDSPLLFKPLIEQSLNPIYVIKNDKLVYVNAAWEKLFGYSADEVYQPDFDYIKIVAEESVNFITSRRKNPLVTENTKSNYEFTGKTKDGRKVNLVANVSQILINNEQFVLGIYQDITETKKIHNSLKETEQRLRNIIENSTILFYSHTPDHRITYVSPQSKTFLDCEPEEALENWQNFLTDNPINNIGVERTNIAIRTGKPQPPYELELKTKKGRIIWVEVHEAPIVENGKTVAMVGSLTDITIKKQAEQALIKAKEKAEESDKLKSQFLAQISHEIRTPINIILNFASLISNEMKHKIDADIKEYLKIMDSSGRRIVRTIDLILNMSEIQTGTYNPIYKMIDIQNDILKPAYEEFKEFIKDKNLAFEIKMLTNQTKLLADEYSVFQIFHNLIHNAIKYTPAGKIEINVNRDTAKNLIVEVNDTGVGIAKEYLPRLFHPFTQEEQGYSRKYEGNGLGLALVKKYCEINNAQINVESEKGKGTTFRVIFPS